MTERKRVAFYETLCVISFTVIVIEVHRWSIVNEA